VDFGRICDLNIVEKNVCVGKDNVVMAGFKDMMIEKYIKKIQESGFTAVVYTQQQDTITKTITRSCAGIFSPGTYFPNETKTLTNNLTCIWVNLVNNKFLMKGKFVVVGVANIDIYTGKTSIFQFTEAYINNPTTYDELERFISIYKPSEVIFISNLPEKDAENVINYTNIQCKSIHKINLFSLSDEKGEKGEKGEKEETEKESLFVSRAKNCEKQIYQKEILQKFYKITDYDIFIQNFYDNDIATQAFCFLLDFVYQHNPFLVKKISEPIFENCSDRLVLANHSLKQLNIIDDYNSNEYSGKHSSVLKMLNECLTPMGKRKFAYNFLNPTTNVAYLEEEYNCAFYK
jgi:DNA mismatch repair protein MutS